MEKEIGKRLSCFLYGVAGGILIMFVPFLIVVLN